MFQVMTQTYEVDALAKMFKFSPAYVKMVLKKVEGYEVGKPVPAEVAERLAQKLSRPWPPEAPSGQ
jgi:hypothetical protein